MEETNKVVYHVLFGWICYAAAIAVVMVALPVKNTIYKLRRLYSNHKRAVISSSVVYRRAALALKSATAAD